MGGHSSRRRIAPSLKQPTRTASGGTSPPSLFGLAPGGVYRAGRRYRDRGGLLPHPFTVTLPKIWGRSPARPAFCCTFPGVAPAGHYPAPSFHGARTFLVPLARAVAARPSGRAYVAGAALG